MLLYSGEFVPQLALGREDRDDVEHHNHDRLRQLEGDDDDDPDHEDDENNDQRCLG